METKVNLYKGKNITIKQYNQNLKQVGYKCGVNWDDKKRNDKGEKKKTKLVYKHYLDKP